MDVWLYKQLALQTDAVGWGRIVMISPNLGAGTRDEAEHGPIMASKQSHAVTSPA